MMAIFGAIIPRFALLVGWYNDPTFWTNVYSSPFLFLLGFIFLPWTTLIDGLSSPNGIVDLNHELIFLAFGLLIDLGTWGIGFVRKDALSETSNNRTELACQRRYAP